MGLRPFRRRQGEPHGWHAHPHPQRRSSHPGRRNRLHHRRRHDRRLRFGDRHGKGRALAPVHAPHSLWPIRAGAGAGDAVRHRGGNWPRRPHQSHRAGPDRRSAQSRRTRFLGLMGTLAPTIVYDLDGTLADTAEDLVATLNWLLGREGLAPLKAETAGSLLGAGARALIKRGFAASGKALDPEATEGLFADYLTYYSAHIVVHTRLYPGVDKALAAFARAGWRQAVCTNKIEGLAKLLITKLGIAERFAFICGQDTFGVGKPDATPLLKTIAASGGAKGRAIMVGDSETDIKTARAAGVPVIAVDFGYTDVPIEELGPDRVISHFDQLMEACDALLAVADDSF